MVAAMSFCHTELEKFKRTSACLKLVAHRAGDVDVVIKTINNQSVYFVSKLNAWMTNTIMTMKTNQTSVNEAEHQKFISQAIQSIFWELHNVQNQGQHLTPPGQVWYPMKS